LIERSQNRTYFDHEGTEGARYREEEASSPEIMVTGDVSSGRLREELERLRALRVELDSDIQALERAMDILGDSSS